MYCFLSLIETLATGKSALRICQKSFLLMFALPARVILRCERHKNLGVFMKWPHSLVLCFISVAFVIPASESQENKPQAVETVALNARMDVNRIDLAFDNAGGLGQDADSYYPAGSDLTFLFSGGIALSGYVQDSLRTAWTISTSRIEEFAEGAWGTSPEDPLARFYAITSADGPGSAAYLNWQDAVSSGAPFEDVNGDGIYDPQVDKPLQLGDKLVWCVFNDDTTPDDRARLGTAPLGVEVQQTVWAYSAQNFLGDVVFIHYRIINRSGSAQKDVIFTSVHDPDLGDYRDDLVGCDTLLQMGYCYNDGADGDYGVNPPAVAVQLLQGPQIEQPHAQASVWDISSKTINHYINRHVRELTSFSYYISSHPTIGDPNFALEARRYQIGGQDRTGQSINPLTFGFGTGADAGTNPLYMYSGDPVTGSGWRDEPPDDKRIMINSGPFDMNVNDTMDVLVALIVGRGSDELNSITVTRSHARKLQSLFPSNAVSYIMADTLLARDDSTMLVARDAVFDASLSVQSRSWTLAQKPDSSEWNFEAFDQDSVLFVPDVSGLYRFSLESEWSNDTVSRDTVSIHVEGITAIEKGSGHPISFHLGQNYPNPFNPSTTIVYELPRREQVSVDIFDSSGRKVATLLDGPKNAGRHELDFNAAHLASGVYYYRLSAGGFVQTKKMLLIK